MRSLCCARQQLSLVIAAAALCWHTAAKADQLRALPVLDPGFSGCPTSTGIGRSADLIARGLSMPDVGPYRVTLPGYTTTGNGAPFPASYAPFLFKVCGGDTLHIKLQSELQGQAVQGQAEESTNLHTHGLIVRPTPDQPGPPGDYVFMERGPHQSADYRIPIPATLPAGMFNRFAQARPYPPGLLWFHAHRHHFAKDQVMGGQAGVLSVGDEKASLRPSSGISFPWLPGFVAATDIKYFALRDIQLNVPDCPAGARDCAPGTAMWPDAVTTPPYDHGVAWLAGAAPAGYDPNACAAPTKAGDGYCGTAGSGSSRVWLFTVNGQRYPTVTMAPGRHQLWRIANLSSNVTYVLELRDKATHQTVPLRVVTLDGVTAGTPQPGNPPLNTVSVVVDSLLLMPASRAEVWVTNPGGGSARDLVLGTKGLLTGTTAGDTWPAVPLAEVRMQAGPTFAPFAARAGQPAAAQPATAPDGWPLDLTLPRRTPALSGDTPAPQLRAMLLGPPSGPGTPAPGLPAASPGCIFLPSGSAWRRQITFEQNDAAGEFKLGSEVVDAAGHPFTDAAGSRVTLIPPMVYPHAVTWQDLMAALAQQDATKTPRHVCPRLGTQEVWELVNKTGEMHNFHIHQSKFRLADGNDRGAPPGLVVAQRQSCTASPEAAVCDPGNVIGQVMPEFDGAIPAGPVDVWHDTLPVPPMANETPGRVFVSIPFKAPEQLGRFVYHCHILEHEDGGMMAPVEVVRPFPVIAQGAPLPATLAATGQNLDHHH